MIIIELAQIKTDSETLYFTSAQHPFEYGGKTHVGGLLKPFPKITQTSRPRAQSVDLTFDANSNIIDTLAKRGVLTGQSVKLIVLWINPDDRKKIERTENVWSGNIGQALFKNSSKTRTVALKIDNLWTMLNKTAGVTSNNASMSLHHPGDNQSWTEESWTHNWGKEGAPNTPVGVEPKDPKKPPTSGGSSDDGKGVRPR